MAPSRRRFLTTLSSAAAGGAAALGGRAAAWSGPPDPLVAAPDSVSPAALLEKHASGSTSGPLSETVGWAGFYLVTALYVIPSFVLIGVIMKYGPEHARGVVRIPDAESS